MPGGSSRHVPAQRHLQGREEEVRERRPGRRRPRDADPPLRAPARGPARLRARLGRVHRPGGRGAGLPLRPDLADLPLVVHLRPGLPGHPRGPGRVRRLLHPGRALLGRGRREACRRPRRPADPGAVGEPRARHGRQGPAQGRRRHHHVRRGRRPPDPAGRRRLHLREQPRLRRRRGLRPARAGARGGPRATTGSTGPTTPATSRSPSASTTAGAGARAATTCTGGAPAARTPTRAPTRCSSATARSSPS